tara:strand:+ start:632 stop:1327 length:696 start_codon:yes stop_codon:yes gene_type:complete
LTINGLVAFFLVVDLRALAMKNFILLGLLTLFTCSHANAGFIGQVTGADMVGMEVTVTFEDNSTETLEWEMFTADASVPYLEGFSGGVEGDGWYLLQAGDTIGEYVNGPLGLWTLGNESNQGIISIFINAIAGNVVFDILFGDDSANGSEEGRPFVAMDPINASFGSNYIDELYGTMLLSNRGDVILGGGSRTLFLVDTDIIDMPVPAPTAAGILMLALGGMFAARRRNNA